MSALRRSIVVGWLLHTAIAAGQTPTDPHGADDFETTEAIGRHEIAKKFDESQARVGAALERSPDKPIEVLNQVPGTDQMLLSLQKTQRFSVRLSRPPLSRVRVNFDDPIHGKHRDYEWDPNRPGALVNEVVLESGVWIASFWSEPIVITGSATDKGHYFVWDLFPTNLLSPPDESQNATENPKGKPKSRTANRSEKKPPGGESLRLGSRAPYDCPIKSVNNFEGTLKLRDLHREGSNPQPYDIRVSVCERGGLPLLSAVKSRFSTAVQGDERRSFEDAVPQQLNELLRIVGEIAYEKAKSKAFGILSSRIEEFVCKDLTVNALIHEKLHLPLNELLLPDTCQVVKHLRFQELGASARSLLQALLHDSARFALHLTLGALEAVVADLQQKKEDRWKLLAALLLPIAKQVLPLAEEMALGKPFTGREAQLLLVELSRIEWIPESFQEQKRSQFAAIVEEAAPEFGAWAKNALAKGESFDTLANQLHLMVEGRKRSNEASLAALLRPMEASMPELRQALHEEGPGALVKKLAALTPSPPLGAEGNAALLRLEAELQKTIGQEAALAKLHEAATTLWDNDKEWNAGVGKIACGLDLAFAVIAECHSRAGCDAREIANLLLSPEKTFGTEDGACWKQGQWRFQDKEIVRRLELIIGRALELTSPRKGSTPRAMMRDGINLAFDVAELVETIGCDALGDSCVRSGLSGTTTALRGLVGGIFDQDIQPVLLQGTALIEKAFQNEIGDFAVACKEHATAKRATCPGCDTAKMASACETELQKWSIAATKATRLVAAVASYSATYAEDAKGDAKLMQAQQDARKKAVESLIDASTDRSQRDGDIVFSLGASVGFGSGYQYTNVASYRGIYIPQIELPMGLAMDLLPDGRNPKSPARHLGLHLQLSVIDLAQYIAMDQQGRTSSLQWQDIFLIGGQVGFIFGTPSNPFLLSGEVRWSPTLFCSSATSAEAIDNILKSTECGTGGAFRVGLSLTYYVPFFDLN